MSNQHTLRSPVALSGIGVHSGQPASVTLSPADPDTGVRFLRADLPDAPPVAARWENVVGTRLATSLGGHGYTIATVEHLLAALHAEGVDNALVAVDGPEVPVLDGSAAPWVDAVRSVGLAVQAARRLRLVVIRTVEVRDGARVARFVPADGLEVAARIDFEHPHVGEQSFSVKLHNGAFAAELAWARTFGFLHEVDALRAAGFALGGGLDNAVVYGPDGVLNPEGLRGADEAVRHKLLDMVGDLALIGMPVTARFEADQPGHALSCALVAALMADETAWEIA